MEAGREAARQEENLVGGMEASSVAVESSDLDCWVIRHVLERELTSLCR